MSFEVCALNLTTNLIVTMTHAIKKNDKTAPLSTSIAPWLSVRNSIKAVEFYKAAFGAVESYRLDIPDGTVVAQLTIDGASFWLSEESPGNNADLSSASAGSI